MAVPPAAVVAMGQPQLVGDDAPVYLLTRTRRLAKALLAVQIISMFMGNVGPFSIAIAVISFMAIRATKTFHRGWLRAFSCVSVCMSLVAVAAFIAALVLGTSLLSCACDTGCVSDAYTFLQNSRQWAIDTANNDTQMASLHDRFPMSRGLFAASPPFVASPAVESEREGEVFANVKYSEPQPDEALNAMPATGNAADVDEVGEHLYGGDQPAFADLPLHGVEGRPGASYPGPAPPMPMFHEGEAEPYDFAPPPMPPSSMFGEDAPMMFEGGEGEEGGAKCSKGAVSAPMHWLGKKVLGMLERVVRHRRARHHGNGNEDMAVDMMEPQAVPGWSGAATSDVTNGKKVVTATDRMWRPAPAEGDGAAGVRPRYPPADSNGDEASEEDPVNAVSEGEGNNKAGDSEGAPHPHPHHVAHHHGHRRLRRLMALRRLSMTEGNTNQAGVDQAHHTFHFKTRHPLGGGKGDDAVSEQDSVSESEKSEGDDEMWERKYGRDWDDEDDDDGDEPDDAGQAMLLHFAAWAGNVTQPQFNAIARKVCSKGAPILAFTLLSIVIILAISVKAAIASRKLVRHPWFIHQDHLRRLRASAAVPQAVAVPSGTGSGAGGEGGMPHMDPNATYRFVPGQGFVAVTSGSAGAPAPVAASYPAGYPAQQQQQHAQGDVVDTVSAYMSNAFRSGRAYLNQAINGRRGYAPVVSSAVDDPEVARGGIEMSAVHMPVGGMGPTAGVRGSDPMSYATSARSIPYATAMPQQHQQVAPTSQPMVATASYNMPPAYAPQGAIAHPGLYVAAGPQVAVPTTSVPPPPAGSAYTYADMPSRRL